MVNFAALLRVLAVVSLGALPAMAGAGSASEVDRESIRSMIRDQINAFHQGDGEAAFAHASPQIRALFKDSDRFMAMVRQGFTQVYGARSITFGDLVGVEGRLLQPVYLVGPKGRSWIAAYAVQQQGDGTWRINGVEVGPDRGSSI